MRTVFRFLAAFALVFLFAAIGLFAMRGAIIETATERALKGSGFDRPQASFGSLSFTGVRLAEISAGGPDKPLTITDAALDFDMRALLFRGRAKALRIGAVEARARLGADGAVEIVGYQPPPPTGKPAPLDAVSVDRLRLALATPQGEALVTGAGAVDLKSGGRISIEARAERAGLAEAALSDATAGLTLSLRADGAIDAAGEATFGIATPFGAASGVSLDIGADAADWRGYAAGKGAPLEGAARIAIRSSSLDAASAPALAAVAQGDAPALRTLTISGAIEAAFSPAATSFSFADGALRIASDAGDALTLSAGAGPLYRRDAQGRRASMKLLAEGRAKGIAAFDAHAGLDGPWRVEASATLKDQALLDYRFDALDATFAGTADAARIDGELTMDAAIARGAIGSLVFVDAPARLRAGLSVDLAAKTARATLAQGACAQIETARMRLVGQEARLGLNAAQLCARDGAPLVAASWGGPFEMTVAAAASARAADYTLGKTTLAGAPPPVAFVARYRPALLRTDVAGAFAGGDMLLNGALRLTRSKGAFTALIEGATMGVDATLEEVVVAQTAAGEAEPMAAPVRADGALKLEKDIATFAFNVRSLRGAALGKGEGRHDVKSGKGSAQFNAGDLVFRRGVLQPEDFALLLKGVVSNTSGAATGTIDFSWAPDVAQSSADFLFAGMSFNGPTLAVTRTEGVSGEVALESLVPLKSNGVQFLSIERVDLDALKLEKGSVEFVLPGDETVRIVKAEFPWFGGRIGAYEASAPLNGSSAATRLEIAAVDLAALLSYLEIEGLSGEGVVEGVLPLTFAGGKARIEKGVLSATGPGVVRYESKSTDAAAAQSAGAELAFEILRELRFTKLTAQVDGPLDGELDFKILFEGFSDLPVTAGGATQRVESPVIYRINIEAPLLALIDQARITTDYELLRDRALQSIEK